MPPTVIRPYAPRDLEGTLRLRPLAYPGWEDAELSEWHLGVYRWLETNPVGPPLRWVIDAGGEIVGHLAAVPLAYRVGGRRIVAHNPTDYMVLPGHGFHAITLMRTLFRAVPSYVACNVAGDVSRIESRFGARAVGDLTQAWRVLDLGRYPRLPGRVPRPAARVAAAALWLGDRVVLGTIERGLRPEVADEFDPSFDAFFERVAAVVPCVPEKGSAFLRWRYGPGTPRTPLTVLVVRDGGMLLGYCVLRTSVRGDGFVLDLMTLPGRRDVARALLRAAATRFWRDRAFVMRYRFVPSAAGPAVADLRRLGAFVGGPGGSGGRGGRERQLELLVKLDDPEADALAGELGNWSYNQGDGEASFWVH